MGQKNWVNAIKIIDYFTNKVVDRFSEAVQYQRIAVGGNDLFAAYIAAYYYHDIRMRYGYSPVVDIFSNTHPSSKRGGNVFYGVLRHLGVDNADISSNQVGSTAKMFANYCLEAEVKYKAEGILVCIPQEEVWLCSYVQRHASTLVNMHYAWLERALPEACQYYNFKAYGRGLLYLAGAAELYAVCSPFEKQQMPQEIQDAGEQLCQQFPLKAAKRVTLKKLWQSGKSFLYRHFDSQTKSVDLEEWVVVWKKELQRKFGSLKGA